MKEVAQALYASKICSYAQGMNIIRAKSMAQDWGIEMGSLARIWKARRCMSVHGGPHTLCLISMLITKVGNQDTLCLSHHHAKIYSLPLRSSLRRS